MVKTYLVTIKNNATTHTSIKEVMSSYSIAKNLWPKADWSCNYGLELDSRNTLHLHTIVKFPTNISMQRYTAMFMPGTSWIVHLKPIKKGDDDKVMDYCLKDTTDDQLLEDISYQHNLQIMLKSINLFKKDLNH